MKTLKRILSVLRVILVIIWGGLIIFSSKSYKADNRILDGYLQDLYGATYSNQKNCAVLSTDSGVKDCLIFYPGANVEPNAYAPLCVKLAQNGIHCIVVDMPYNLAFFGVNSADNVIKTMDELNLGIENYYIAGHSLGGVAACSYADKNSDNVKGVILLASYSTKDLCDDGLPILSVYGSNDGVLNAEAYEKNKSNIADNLTETVIEGGNHAYFGIYGEQKGDYAADISNAEQIDRAADAIIKFISENK